MKNQFVIQLLAFIGLSFFISRVSGQVYSVNTEYTTAGALHKNSVFKTSDGKKWKKVCDSMPMLPRITYGVTYFKNQIWVYGGNHYDTSSGFDSTFSDIYSSKNGKKWKKGKNPSMGQRAGNTLIVYKNEMYSLGGCYYDSFSAYGNRYYGRIYSYSVFKTSDGKKWKKVSDSVPFQPNPGSFHAFVLKDTLFVISDTLGAIFYGVSHQVWFTVDGKKWILKGTMPVTTYNSGIAVFSGKVYKIGGLEETSQSASRVVSIYNSGKWTTDTMSSLPKSDHYGEYVFNNNIYCYVNNEVWKLVGTKWKKQSSGQPINPSSDFDQNYHFITISCQNSNTNSSYTSLDGSHSESLCVSEVKQGSIDSYPNPAIYFASIECSIQTGSLQLFDLSGRIVQTVKIENGIGTIQRNDLPSGIYVARIGSVSSKIVFY